MAIEVTAGAVVYRHGQAGIEYLLLQSMNKGNFTGFPKGHVEAGESLVRQRPAKLGGNQPPSRRRHQLFRFIPNTTCPTATASR